MLQDSKVLSVIETWSLAPPHSKILLKVEPVALEAALPVPPEATSVSIEVLPVPLEATSVNIEATHLPSPPQPITSSEPEPEQLIVSAVDSETQDSSTTADTGSIEVEMKIPSTEDGRTDAGIVVESSDPDPESILVPTAAAIAEIMEEGTAEVKEEDNDITKVKEEDNTNVKEEDNTEVKEEDNAEFKEEDSGDTKEEDIADVKEEDIAAQLFEEITWEFVNGAKDLLGTWSGLQEVFRIPKKERVEQIKEHEREADQGDGQDRDRVSSYDRDRERYSAPIKLHL